MRILLTIAATLAFLATASAQNTATDKAATDKAPAEKAAAVAPEAGGTTLQPAGEQKAHSCAGKADAKAGCCAGKTDAKACAGHDHKAHGEAHAGQILGDHGADVIKIEPPAGDETRGWGPPFLDGTAANGGRLTLVAKPFGKSTADASVSDRLDDLRHSVYSVGAAKERRIEVEQVMGTP